MTETTESLADATTRNPSLAGIATIVVTGVALGLFYNWIGLQPPNDWGLSWRAVDKMAALEVVGAVETVPVAVPVVSDDPLAVPAIAGSLPAIPDVGRPVAIELDALKQYVDQSAALIVDARDAEEFAAGHIPGAINLFYDEVVSDPARLETLETGGRPLITYCGGGGCELSLSLAEELIYAGHHPVAVYIGGYPQWTEAGHSVETGP